MCVSLSFSVGKSLKFVPVWRRWGCINVSDAITVNRSQVLSSLTCLVGLSGNWWFPDQAEPECVKYHVPVWYTPWRYEDACLQHSAQWYLAYGHRLSQNHQNPMHLYNYAKLSNSWMCKVSHLPYCELQLGRMEQTNGSCMLSSAVMVCTTLGLHTAHW